MESKETGGFAFPANHYDLTENEHGMTLRDYFASKVLVTACENNGPKEAAELAYLYADAMLEARK